ncbi:AbrB/MazE/SpoVT family DNA-binding domain-containing protein [uncultured Rhodospira sp.]|uniref:AbrB/MazE/SpoVT family DNA-binding domain-containing protein n=1 Tax=uncultured Rhodospira sp. TaxID=1936189 RepID=UPI00260A6BCC|nr:AbrB/MazE/SpoVT family DNA-binding domain-containing protein [uncultured Rhodospira sp.]
MKVNLIAIGNSKGVRLPSAVIKECGFGETLEMSVENGRVILEPARHPRAGWEDAFKRMAAAGDDERLMPDTMAHSWDDEAWTW